MATIDIMLERNRRILESHQPLPTMEEIMGKGPVPPRTAIVTCGDPRCHPEYYFDIGPTESLVLRNAGGRVTSSVIENVVAVDALAGIGEVAIVHHTDCGALRFDDEKLRELVVQRGVSAEEAAQLKFGGFTSVEQGVKDDLATWRSSKLLRPELARACRGFIFDIATGKVAEVDQ